MMNTRDKNLVEKTTLFEHSLKRTVFSLNILPNVFKNLNSYCKNWFFLEEKTIVLYICTFRFDIFFECKQGFFVIFTLPYKIPVNSIVART